MQTDNFSVKTDNFEFFWGGPFSQWYKSRFNVDGVYYNCAEQYMMAMKAAFFEDYETLETIMQTSDPKAQKALGRQVKNFNADRWNAVARDFVFKANLAKFSPDHMKQMLLGTGDKEIVEASPYDKIWGIGMSETDPDRFDKSKWRGTNWLGEVLMLVRTELRK